MQRFRNEHPIHYAPVIFILSQLQCSTLASQQKFRQLIKKYFRFLYTVLVIYICELEVTVCLCIFILDTRTKNFPDNPSVNATYIGFFITR